MKWLKWNSNGVFIVPKLLTTTQWLQEMTWFGLEMTCILKSRPVSQETASSSRYIKYPMVETQNWNHVELLNTRKHRHGAGADKSKKSTIVSDFKQNLLTLTHQPSSYPVSSHGDRKNTTSQQHFASKSTSCNQAPAKWGSLTRQLAATVQCHRCSLSELRPFTSSRQWYTRSILWCRPMSSLASEIA